jgi:hypothetical protein
MTNNKFKIIIKKVDLTTRILGYKIKWNMENINI